MIYLKSFMLAVAMLLGVVVPSALIVVYPVFLFPFFIIIIFAVFWLLAYEHVKEKTEEDR